MNNTKVKPKFNIFDRLIVIVVLACIAGLVVLALSTGDGAEVNGDTAEINFTVYAVANETLPYFEAGDSVFLTSTGVKIGTLDSFDTVPADLDISGPDGKAYVCDNPDRTTLHCKMTVTGKNTDNGFYISGNQLAAGGTMMYLYTKNVDFEMTVTDIAVVSSGNS